MSSPALIREPYRKRPTMPQDLSTVDPRPRARSKEQEQTVREALVSRGAVDLVPMLFGPILSGDAS